MTTPSAYRILVVDDTPTIHEDFRKVLGQATGGKSAAQSLAAAIFGDTAAPDPELPQFRLDSALQGQEGLALVETAIAEEQPYAVAFVDMRMPPGWDGLETIRRIWQVDPEVQIVICTAYSDYSWHDTIRSLGVTSNLLILKKPFDNTEILQLTHALARKWLLARQHAAHVSSLDELVRQRTEELRRAEETFSQAFAANPHAQAIIALDHPQLLAVNPSFERAFNLSAGELVGLSPETIGRGVDPTRLEALLARLRLGESVDHHPFVFTPSPDVRRDMVCSARPVTISGRPCSIWVYEDVTERLQIENQLRQAQKLEAVGQLAAGVAHDFNNLLTVIQCYTSELLADPANGALKPSLEPIHAAALRAATLTRQLLVFSRKQITQFEEVNLASILTNLRPFLNRLIGEHVTLRWNFPAALPAIRGDAAALEQIVVNLVVNARDASQAGGTITLSVDQRHFASAAEANHAEAQAGHYLALAVTDTGSGIPPDILPRIFEPFFTTKEVGKGTGLGLSTVYSLARQHAGWIDVRTSLGRGTTFTVFLPIVAAAPGLEAGEDFTRRTPEALPPLHILAVEDDPTIQAMLRVIFKRYQLPCTVVSDGHHALAEWKESGPFDLLITDIVMPGGISGVDLARQFRSTCPDLPIVFITGYSPEHVAGEDLHIPGPPTRTTLKPFSIATLTEAIFEVLRPTRPSA